MPSRKSALTLLAMAAASLVLLLRATSLGALQTAPATDEWGPITEGAELRAQLERTVTPPVVPVVVHCILRNVSGEVCQFYDSYPEHDYRLDIRNQQGEPVHATGDASCVWRRTTQQLGPGEETVDVYCLNRMYLLTEAGEYTIVARRLVPTGDWDGFADVESGAMVLAVSDDSTMDNPRAIGDWGAVTQGLQLRIEADPPVVRPRQPLFVWLTTRNARAPTVSVIDAASIHDYRVAITDSHEQQVPIERSCIENLERVAQELLPGDEIVYRYDLNRKYDLTIPGEYTLIFKRRVPRLDGPGTAWVESNPVVLTVQEAGPLPGV